jgi:hypothetical protein
VNGSAALTVASIRSMGASIKWTRVLPRLMPRFVQVDGRFAQIDTRFNWLIGIVIGTGITTILTILFHH